MLHIYSGSSMVGVRTKELQYLVTIVDNGITVQDEPEAVMDIFKGCGEFLMTSVGGTYKTM